MVKKKRIRARNREGQYLPDNKKTPYRNEAYKEMMSVIDGYNDSMYRFGSLWEWQDV